MAQQMKVVAIAVQAAIAKSVGIVTVLGNAQVALDVEKSVIPGYTVPREEKLIVLSVMGLADARHVMEEGKINL